jgi:hypothetical protein
MCAKFVLKDLFHIERRGSKIGQLILPDSHVQQHQCPFALPADETAATAAFRLRTYDIHHVYSARVARSTR